MVYNNIII